MRGHRSVWAVRFIGALVVCTSAPVARGDNTWSQFHGDAGRTAFVDTSLDAGRFAPAWSTPLDFEQDRPFSWTNIGLASDGQRVFLTDYDDINYVRTFYSLAYDVTTGAKLWQTALPGSDYTVAGAPAYSGGSVYVNRAGDSQPNLTADYPKLFSVDAATGKVNFATPYQAQFGVDRTPMPSGNQVFSGAGYYGGMNAYDAATGSTQWSLPLNYIPADVWTAVDNKDVYVNSNLYDRVTAAPDGQFVDPNYQFLLSPVVSGAERFFIASVAGNAYVAFDAATRQIVWEHPTSDHIDDAAVGTNEIALNIGGSSIDVLDRHTGATEFTWSSGAQINQVMILTDNYLFVNSGLYVYAIDLKTGLTAWSAAADGEMALVDGYLIVRNNFSLTAFHVPEPGTGALLACGILMIGAAGFRRELRRRVNGR